MHVSYWSCSKFADIVRGTEKPSAASGSGWKQWEKEAKAKHPIRFWLAEELLDRIQNTIMWPYDKTYSLKYYIVNRWIDQSHALVAHPKHIKPGQYMDLSERVLICLFDELVDFVEIECAYNTVRWDEDEVKKLRWWQAGRWRTRTYRDAKAGLAHLEWAMSLTDEEWLPEDKKAEAKPTSQAIAAKETAELYKWWIEIRPNRPDPHDISGWSERCEDQRRRGIGFLEDDPQEDRAETHAILDKTREIEQAYEGEDEEMLIRLIKIRKSLWS